MIGPAGKMGLWHRLTMTCVVVLNLPVVTAQLPSPRANHAIDPQLSLILQANAEISQETGLKETMAWIDNLHSAPACTQLASSKLLTDCQLLDNPQAFTKAHPDQVLEDVQNEYALKLAICEYVGAQHSNPKAPSKCQAFLPSRQACMKRSWSWRQEEVPDHELCYPRATKADLSQCLTTMQSSAQTWTSYSNARSRAMHICRLSRQHIEKEEALQLYKNLTLVISKLHDSVQPLESKLQAMEDQLHMYSDDSRRFFDQSQEAAESFTAFAKGSQRQHQNQLKETNQSLRNMQSEVAALQEQANEHYASLNAKFEARMEASLAKGMEVVAYNQADALAQFATNMGIVYQSLTKELSGQFERYNAELQDYHEKNMLAIQQQHATTVQSFSILQTGLDSAASNVDGLNDKTGTLRSELDGTIAQVGTVNEGLGSLASMAQTAGQFMANFDSFFAYLAVGGTALGLVFFANCVSSVPVVGNAFRQLSVTSLAILLCGVSSYAISRSFSIPIKLKTMTDKLVEVDLPGQSILWLQTAACVSLLTCIPFVLYKAFSGHMPSLCTLLPSRFQLSRRRVPPPSQSLPPQRNVEHTFSKEALEDEELLARLKNFQRAKTVC